MMPTIVSTRTIDLSKCLVYTFTFLEIDLNNLKKIYYL